MRTPSRRLKLIAAITFAALGLAVAVALGVFLQRPTACKRCPNVVVFETDDQTVADMAALRSVRTLIADRGITFTNSFVNYSDCCPSRATFLTGQYAQNHHVLSNKPPDGGFYRLDSDNTLPVWLQHAGYYTIFIGKYLNDYGHRGATAVPPGWNEWDAAIDFSKAQRGTRAQFYNVTYNRDGKLTRLPAGLYRTDADAQTARDTIRQRGASRRPFFMWLAVLAPHGGLPVESDDPPESLSTPARAPGDRGRFKSLALPKPPNFNEADVSDKPRAVRAPRMSQLRISEVQNLFQQRREALLAVDRAVASVIRTLQDTGQLQNTVLIFTSDNGFMLGEHRIAPDQQYLYEPAIRVPLAVAGPGIPRGQTRNQLVVNADLAPTIASLAHAHPDLTVDGMSLVPVLRNAHSSFRSQFPIMVGPRFKGLQFNGIRTTRYVYAHYADGEEELYDLRRDPYEFTNRASDPAYHRILAQLRTRTELLKRCKGAECR